MNMVNGWMFTGLGPFYLKDSSTAQNILASGIAANFAAAGASDVISSVANLSKNLQQGGEKQQSYEDLGRFYKQMMDACRDARPVNAQTITAEIHVFEPFVTQDGQTEWRQINPSAVCFADRLLGQSDFGPQTRIAPEQAHAAAMSIITTVAKADGDARAARAAADAQSRALFALQTGAAVASPPVIAGENAAALQALNPPVPASKHPWLDWLCGKRPQTTTKSVIGPTTASQP
jgi:hypothetical protein